MTMMNSPHQVNAATYLEKTIRAEQIRLVCKNSPAMLAAEILIPLALMYAWWDVVDRAMMMAWVGLIYGIALLQSGIFIAYNARVTSTEKTLRLGKYLAVCSFAYGILWGAAGVYMSTPGMPEQFLIMLFILAGFGAGAVVSGAIYLPAFYMFFFPSLLPLIVSSFLDGSRFSNVLAITVTLFFVVMAVFANNLHKVFKQSLRLRFENIDLVNELTAQRNELEIQKEIAERANAAKTRFLAAASHDLRQPLHAMGLFISALSERVRGSVTHKLVLQLDASTGALRGLLNALLDISRLDAGVIHPRIMPCSVQNLFDQIAIECTAQAEEKNISLCVAPTSVWVMSDATLLERIIRNLVLNAIRYTDKGGVLLGCRHRGDQLRIEVWDSGIGIAAHELNNIFHEFYQIGNPERDRNNGLGLGLAIAQRLARLFDNRIEVKSVLKKGSVFALTLPKCNATIVSHELPAISTTGHLQTSMIIVIDDELAIREATQLMLESWGCEVLLADTGEAALIAVAEAGRKPDAIIADYRLRDNKNGVDAVHGLHKVYGCDIPVIIITGDTAPDRLRETETSGYHLLHKPLAPARLRALLTHVISGT